MGKLGNSSMPPVDLSTTEPVVCSKCGKQIFTEGLLFRKVSPLLTGTGQPGLVPINVLYCVDCGTILEEYLPSEVKDIVAAEKNGN